MGNLGRDGKRKIALSSSKNQTNKEKHVERSLAKEENVFSFRSQSAPQTGMIFSSNSPFRNKWNYYDDLRSNVADFLHLPHENSNINSVVTKPGSAVVMVNVSSPSSDSNQEQHTYRMCTLSSFAPLSLGKGRPQNRFYDSAKVALMAIRDFNDGIESVVPNLPTSASSSNGEKPCNIRLVLDFYDPERSPLMASTLLSREVLSKDHPYKATAVVGAARSAVSEPLAVLNSVSGIPQVSHASTSTDLDDPEKLFGRVVPSTKGDAAAAVDYLYQISNGGITHIAIVYVRDGYGTAYRQSIMEAAHRKGVRVEAFAISYDQDAAGQGGARDRISDAIDGIVSCGVRYVVGAIFQRHIADVMKEAMRRGVAGPGYFWIFGDGISSNYFRNIRLDPAIDSDCARAFHGVGHLMLGIDKASERYNGLIEQWKGLIGNEEFGEYFESKQPKHTDSIKFLANHTSSPMPSTYSVLLYDAVMSLGIAACSIKDPFFDGVALFDAFKKTKFDGSTGRVEMDEDTGTRDYQTVVYTVSNVLIKGLDKEGKIFFDVNLAAEYRLMDDENHVGGDDTIRTPQWVSVGDSFNYSDFSNVPPVPLPPLIEDKNLIGLPLKLFGLFMCAVVLFSSLFFAWWTYQNRRSRIIRASQPVFLMMLCMGAFITGLSFIPLAFEDVYVSQGIMDASCMAVWWTYCFGFVLTMSALFSKTWRINKIMNYEAFRRVQVKWKDVILPGIVMLFANLAVLMTWTIVSPAKYERRHNPQSLDKYGRATESVGTCVSEDGGHTIFLSTLLSINGAVLLIANYQAWKARNIATEYSESRYIGLAMMSILQTYLLGAPVTVASNTLSKENFLVKILCIFVSSGVVLFLIFLPKMIFFKEFNEKRKLIVKQKEIRKISDPMFKGTSDNSIKRSKDQKNVLVESDPSPKNEDGYGCNIVQNERELRNVLRSCLEEAESTHEDLVQKRISLQAQLSDHRRSSSRTTDVMSSFRGSSFSCHSTPPPSTSILHIAPLCQNGIQELSYSSSFQQHLLFMKDQDQGDYEKVGEFYGDEVSGTSPNSSRRNSLNGAGNGVPFSADEDDCDERFSLEKKIKLRQRRRNLELQIESRMAAACEETRRPAECRRSNSMSNLLSANGSNILPKVNNKSNELRQKRRALEVYIESHIYAARKVKRPSFFRANGKDETTTDLPLQCGDYAAETTGTKTPEKRLSLSSIGSLGKRLTQQRRTSRKYSIESFGSKDPTEVNEQSSLFPCP